MQSVDHLLQQLNTFIRGDSFFYYHGVVLSVAWLFGAVVAILSRKVSITLHALLFFVIDFLSAFFIIGGMIRVYPYLLDKWNVWPLLKTGHFVGGGVFLVMLIIQHVGGVSTLLKGIKYNRNHRVLGFYVSNFGRILAVFGFVIANAEPWIIATSGAITVFLLVASAYKVFFANKPAKPAPKIAVSPDNRAKASPDYRAKSPKRD